MIDFEGIIRSIQSNENHYKKRFLIQFGQKIKKVEVEEAAYFYALEKTVFLTTKTGKSYPVDYTLDKLQEMLDPVVFFRINRKIIISFDSIVNMIPYSRSRIKVELNPPTMKNIETVVSVERSASFKNWLDK